MISCILLYALSSESEEECNTSLIRRQIRDKSNPLSLSNAEFKRRFRLTKEAFNYVLSEIDTPGHMSTSASPTLQLAATLTFLASGSFQHNVGNDFLIGLAQSTLCKIITNTSNEIQRKLCPKVIKFSPQDSSQCMEAFMNEYRLPGVIGCVDGTHFGLQKPSSNEHMFFNRKGYHSLNSMIISDHEYKILAINSKYGGAAHDSFVWKHSHERNTLQELYSNNSLKNVWLLGDSGYPLEPWCITPYRNAEDCSMQARFNDVHSKGRCIIERTIGILKARWKILSNDKRSRYTPDKMAVFGNVCAGLHNICVQFKVPRYTDENAQETSYIEVDTGEETHLTKMGKKIRDQLKLSLENNN